jgi:hypothetical protein
MKFEEGMTHDFKNLDSLPTQSIEVNKKLETVSELESKISSMFGIP